MEALTKEFCPYPCRHSDMGATLLWNIAERFGARALLCRFPCQATAPLSH